VDLEVRYICLIFLIFNLLLSSGDVQFKQSNPSNLGSSFLLIIRLVLIIPLMPFVCVDQR